MCKREGPLEEESGGHGSLPVNTAAGRRQGGAGRCQGKNGKKPKMPSVEQVQEALSKVESPDDFFGKDGVFAELFSDTMEQMLEAELTTELGYEPYEAAGRNSGNSRNGHYDKTLRTSAGDTRIRVPRDRNGEYEPTLIKKYASNTNELEHKILGLYAKGQQRPGH